MATESVTGITPKIAVSGAAEEVNTGESAQAKEAQQERQEIAEARRALIDEQIQVSREKIDKVVSELKDFVQTMQRDLNFHVDDATGRVVIRVVESSTNKVVRQIPEEEVLALAQRLEMMLEEMPKGMLLEGEA